MATSSSITLAPVPKHGLDAKVIYGQCLGIRVLSLHPIWLWMCFELDLIWFGIAASVAFEALLWFAIRQRSMQGDGLAYYIGVVFGFSMPLFGALAAMLLVISGAASPVGFLAVAGVVASVEIGSWLRARRLDMSAVLKAAKKKKVVAPDGGNWTFNLWDTDILTKDYVNETIWGKIARYWLPVVCLLLVPAANIQIYVDRNLEMAAAIAAVIALLLGIGAQNSTYFVHATRRLFTQLRVNS